MVEVGKRQHAAWRRLCPSRPLCRQRRHPNWKLRYRFAGKSRVMNLGSDTDLPPAAARQSAKELRTKIALGPAPGLPISHVMLDLPVGFG